jgi:hypothetical protein
MKQAVTLILALSFSITAASMNANKQSVKASGAFIHAEAFAQAKMPYIGKWSNGRGETLSVTKRALRFNSDKPVTFRDVTKVTDGKYFLLKITTPGAVNYFTKFISLVIENGEMKMTLYDSYEDMFDGKNPQGESTWDRDK